MQDFTHSSWWQSTRCSRRLLDPVVKLKVLMWSWSPVLFRTSLACCLLWSTQLMLEELKEVLTSIADIHATVCHFLQKAATHPMQHNASCFQQGHPDVMSWDGQCVGGLVFDPVYEELQGKVSRQMVPHFPPSDEVSSVAIHWPVTLLCHPCHLRYHSGLETHNQGWQVYEHIHSVSAK